MTLPMPVVFAGVQQHNYNGAVCTTKEKQATVKAHY